MNKSLHRRLRVFSVAVVMVTLVLTGRLAWLQIYQYEHYLARAENNRLRNLPITATRGEIFDRNGELLAGNRPGFAVSLLDLPSRDAKDVIGYLSELLGMEEDEIRKRIRQQQFRRFAPIRLVADVPAHIVANLEERSMELPGVLIETLPVRRYPFNSLAAHAIGYVGTVRPEDKTFIEQAAERGIFYRFTDIIGHQGVERTWDHYLRGEDGYLQVETNRYGRRVRVLDKQDPVPGNNLHLTLDARLQMIAESALDEVISNLREQGNDQVGKGSVVALDPNTGGILAMVSYPSFDLNTFRNNIRELNENPFKPQINRAIDGQYPVGSTYKMITGVGALEEGLISEKSIITCTGARQFFPGDFARRCYNNNVHGSQSIVTALARSCNIFFFELGKRLGVDKLTAYAEDFGFGSPTGLTDLTGEKKGVLLRRKEKVRFNPGDVLTAAIGQGHTITPLQLANYAAMLANGGIHYRPHLVHEVADHAGNVILTVEPEVLRQLDYKDSTWNAIRKGMEAVTVPGGTAGSMRQLPVKVAGKTGSAQAGAPNSGIFAHSLFVGYAPADAPEIAIAVIVEHGRLGGHAAVPVANRIFSQYYSVTPEPEPVEDDVWVTD